MRHDDWRAIARLELYDDQDKLVRNAQGEASWGTAFLTSKHFALSAYHVVADRKATGFVLKAHRFELVFVRAGETRVRLRTPTAALADRDLDVILLELEQGTPAGVEPMVSSGEVICDEPFVAWGFAGLNPRDGLGLSGKVEHAASTVVGQPALQLYCLQAAAPNARIAGLSGGPCCVEGRVVGVVRSYLERDDAAVGGTVYASPMAEVLKQARFARHIRVDPCAELPALPEDHPWPPEPFRDLRPFGPIDARVFFGRCAELSRLRRAIEDPSGRIILLYGQTGVGKSSLLHAGLEPRLRGQWDVRYARRDPARGLSQTLEQLGVSARNDRPCLLLLDQVEEAITRPLMSGERELTDLTFALAQHASRWPHDRVVLGFRKEWLSEITRALSTQQLSREAVLLQPMGPAAVEEVVLGLERSPRMKEYYQIKIDLEVAPQIAQLLCSDRQSAIAPALQVLLTKLWKSAGKRSSSPRRIDVALVKTIAEQGLGLGDVLDRRLEHLSKGNGGRVLGLFLDLLRLHVTDAGTSARVTRLERAAVYAKRENEAEQLVRELVSEYLLVDAREDGQDAVGDTALAHDALGPLVLSRFATSDLPGQRARRILENRADGESLDSHDLALVENGLQGMRSPNQGELALIKKSRQRRRCERLTRRALVAAFAVLGVIAAVSGIRSYLSSVDLAAELHARALTQAALVFEEGLRTEEIRGEPLAALRQIAQAVALAPADDPRLSEYITKLVHTTAAGPSIVSMIPADDEITAADYANGRLAVLMRRGELRVFRLEDGGPVGGIEPIEIGRLALDPSRHSAPLSLDPLGHRALISSTPGAMLVDLNEPTGLRSVELEARGRVSFAADGVSLIARTRHSYRVVQIPTLPPQGNAQGESSPSIWTTLNTEEPPASRSVRTARPYVLRPNPAGDKPGGWQLVDAISDKIADTIAYTAGAHMFARISSDASTVISWRGSANNLVRWDLPHDRSEVVFSTPVQDAFIDATGHTIIAQVDPDDMVLTVARDQSALLASTGLWTRDGVVALPGCSRGRDTEWVRWIDDRGNVLCRGEGWLRCGPSGHVGFARGTHPATKPHLHDGMLDRSPLLQVVDAGGRRLLELWPSGELRAWPLDGPHGTSKLPSSGPVERDDDARQAPVTSRDGRARLENEDGSSLIKEHQSSQILLRLGDAETEDSKLFEKLFAEAMQVNVSPDSASASGRVELGRGPGQLPVVAWKVGGHTVMRAGGSDIAPPAADYDDYVLSGDGRFGAALSHGDPSIRLWRNRMLRDPHGAALGPERSYWLAPKERLPGDVARVSFHEREGALWLKTVLTDGSQREHYVSESFPRHPPWTTKLPWLLGGELKSETLQAADVQNGVKRRAAIASFADDPSHAARWLRHGFFESP